MSDAPKPILLTEPEMSEREVELAADAIRTGWVSSAGPLVTRFEELVAEYTRAAKAVATVNGTAALHLAMRLLGIGPGDEVIVPTLTFVATVTPVVISGATPVFVDVQPDTINMDPAKIEASITPRTKAIVPVHLYGHPADMDPILEIAAKHGLEVIEDATNALGSIYRGATDATRNRAPGTMGRIGCFSFNANKIITTGGGGMLVTMDEDLGDRARYLVNQASDPGREFYHSAVGFNYRLPNVLAALGVGQMERLAEFVEKKRDIARLYQDLLEDAPGIACAREMPWAFNCWWMFSIFVDSEVFGATKDDVLDALTTAKIGCRPLFVPNHTLEPYREYPHGEIEVAPRLWQTGLQLPASMKLTPEDQERVVKTILKTGETKRKANR